jgi:hypothetical protein
MAVIIEVVGAKELIAKLNTLKAMERVKGAIATAGADLKGFMKEYPSSGSVDRSPNPNLRGNSAAAKKNRAGFFYHLKHGDIGVPYSRHGFLGDHWTYKPENNGWTAVIGNNIRYNSLVQGPDQTRRHANTGWLTVDKAKDKYGPAIIEAITQALEEEVANVG